MHTRTTGHLLLASLSAALLTTGLDAQQRPAQTRSIPLDVVCGPLATFEKPTHTLKVLGGTERVKRMFAAGETILVNGGSAQGVQAGQHFYVRRIIEDRFTSQSADVQPRSIHTAGWITIAETQANVSVATVVETCDPVQEGDYLEPMVLPDPAKTIEAGEPDFSRPGRILLGDDRRQLGATGSVMVFDRGSDHGVRAGQRLTIFRDTVEGTGPVISIGSAVIVAVRADSSLVRIEKAREAIHVGDKVAIHR